MKPQPPPQTNGRERRQTSSAQRSGTLAELIDLVPEGWTLAHYRDRTYSLVRTTRVGGRSISVLAQELGGPDLVSANIYRTTAGELLRACEMPQQKVIDFLRGWQPTPTAA